MSWDYKHDRVGLNYNPSVSELQALQRLTSVETLSLMEVAAYMRDQQEVAPCHECRHAVLLTEGLCYPCWLQFKSVEFKAFQKIDEIAGPEAAGQWSGFG